jgi:hypothetical protein
LRCRGRYGGHLPGCREVLGRVIRRIGCRDDVVDQVYPSRSEKVCKNDRLCVK